MLKPMQHVAFRRRESISNTRNVLVVGPRISKGGPLGGVVVLFEQFLSELERRKIRFCAVDSNKANYRNFAWAVISAGFGFIWAFRRSKLISLHLQNNDYTYMAPIVVTLSRLFGKTISLRKFAGNFDELFDEMGWLRQKMVTFAIKHADQCFFETQYLVDKFRQFNEATYWFPNSRSVPCVTRRVTDEYRKKLVFVGSVRREKGIDDILQASLDLDDSYSISIYGPIADPKYVSLDWSQYPRVAYKGQVSTSNIPKILAEQDILLLPSYWEGEGYPGVIIEALQTGLPVIASRCRGVEEMITDGVEGALIDPSDVIALVAVIRSMNDNKFKSMSNCARRRGQTFDSKMVTGQFLEKIGLVS